MHPAETNPDRYAYEHGRASTTAEANSVIAGVLDAEPAAEGWVAEPAAWSCCLRNSRPSSPLTRLRQPPEVRTEFLPHGTVTSG
ncbi:hypothetical protein ACWEQU_04660 [Streptomyces nodosus]